MKTYAVFTHFVENAAEKRAPHREAHLAHLRELHAAGKLVLGGALQEPMDQGLLVFRAESKEEILALLATDSYAQNGIWTKIVIREWTVVVGNPAA
ncbi:MAG: YciI family protein [Polyangiaceae bacterium]